MQALTDFWTSALLAGILLGVIVLPFLFRLKKKPSRLLGVLQLILILNLLNYLLIRTGAYVAVPHLTALFQPLLFLIGPLYYFYLRSLFDVTAKIRPSHWPHFILFLLACYYHAAFILLPAGEKIRLLHYHSSLPFVRPTTEMVAYIFIHGTQGLFYTWLSASLIRRQQVSYSRQFMNWTTNLNTLLASFWLLIIVWAVYLLFAPRFIHEADYLVMLAMAVVVSLPAYLMIYLQPQFAGFLLGRQTRKYERSSLSDEQSAAIHRKLLQLMETEKPFLDPGLKISTLAARISVSANLLSQVINQETGTNFHGFINEYRMAEAMRRLKDPASVHLSILGIAFESGFSNKNTFNRLFRQHTGQTPSEFVRTQLMTG